MASRHFLGLFQPDKGAGHPNQIALTGWLPVNGEERRRHGVE